MYRRNKYELLHYDTIHSFISLHIQLQSGISCMHVRSYINELYALLFLKGDIDIRKET